MEITSTIPFTGIRHSEEKRIEIEEQVYLVSKHGVSIRKEIILEKAFDRIPMDNGIAQHLSYKGAFNIDGKLLEVTAENKTTYGPLGDRLLLNASYDGKVVGNYSALRSYMGGGSNGKWPFLKTGHFTIIFTLKSTGFGSDSNVLRLEYFQTIIHDPYVINEDEKGKSLLGKNLSPEFLNATYEIEELEIEKVIEWLVPIKNEKGDEQIGKIACCTYPGYEIYRNTYYGNLMKISEIKDKKIFIGRATDERSLFTLEIELNDKREILFPWQQTDISYTI